jgi:hypothetical protein
MNDTPPPTSWAPLTPQQVPDLLTPLGVRWWIAGGVAIDLAAGRTTRAHGDIDVALLWSDAPRLAPLRGAWDIRIAHDGTLLRWDGRELAPEHHQLWMRRKGVNAWEMEVLLEQHNGGEWIYRRNGLVTCALDLIDATTVSGVPYLRPEVVLLYKSNRPQLERNAQDFETALPLLDAPSRAWLRSALRVLDARHPWVPRITAAG